MQVDEQFRDLGLGPGLFDLHLIEIETVNTHELILSSTHLYAGVFDNKLP